MPAFVALCLWFVLLLALLRFDGANRSRTSPALWIPTVWMFIAVSRLPSQWLGSSQQMGSEAFEQGNSLDRGVYIALILLAIGVLVSRRFKWGEFLARNIALTALLSFALLSALWSDFPFVAAKRWVRDLGSYLMILVALSDPRPLEAVSTVLRRLAYLVMPLSIVLHKYYPAMGRQYDVWSGQVSYVGATTSKNMLGILCMVSGLFFLWDTLTRWHGRKDPGSRRVLLVNGGFLLMTLWLLSLADSATSTVCLVLGCVILVSAHGQIGPLRRRVAAVLIPAGVCLGLVLSLAFWGAVGGQLAPLLGRDATLTDRTEIWQVLAAMQTNPMIGSGYESFWLGSRLEQVWGHGFLINQAHNGYLQVYLNLGAIGLSLLIGVMAAAYRKISTGLSGLAAGCSFALAVWVVLVVYNVTEAAFLGGLLWSTLLLFMGPFTEPCTAPVGAQEPAKGIRPTWRRPKTVAPARAVQRPFTARTAPSKAQSSAAARPGRLIRLQDRFRTSKNVTPTRGSLGRRR